MNFYKGYNLIIVSILAILIYLCWPSTCKTRILEPPIQPPISLKPPSIQPPTPLQPPIPLKPPTPLQPPIQPGIPSEPRYINWKYEEV